MCVFWVVIFSLCAVSTAAAYVADRLCARRLDNRQEHHQMRVCVRGDAAAFHNIP